MRRGVSSLTHRPPGRGAELRTRTTLLVQLYPPGRRTVQLTPSLDKLPQIAQPLSLTPGHCNHKAVTNTECPHKLVIRRSLRSSKILPNATTQSVGLQPSISRNYTRQLLEVITADPVAFEQKDKTSRRHMPDDMNAQNPVFSAF
jgi:hypothetical protein